VSSVRTVSARLSHTGLGSVRCGSPAVLCGCALAAWAALGLDARSIILPGLCAPWALLPGVAASVDLVLTFNPPATLAISWALMIAAMTPPLLVAPLRRQ
jgi:hypothetical protein